MGRADEISQLVDTIHVQGHAIEQYLRDGNGGAESLPLPRDLEPSRGRVLDAMDQLRISLLGPASYFAEVMSSGVHLQTCLTFVYRFRVAQRLPLRETLSYEELASRCQVQLSDLRRFLRALIAHRIFCEPANNKISHNAISQTLVTIPNFDDLLGLRCEDLWPAGMRAVDAMTTWPMSLDRAHTGFALTSNNDKPFFDAIAQDPARHARFARAMEMMGSTPPMAVSFLIQNLEWLGDRCPRKVVDIGGSQGRVAVELLRKFPGIESIIVQDLPEVIQGASVPADLTNKLELMEHDFFHEQVLKDCDVYLMRIVLHDWPDRDVVSILKRQAAVLKPGARIVLNEMCLPEPGQLLPHQDRRLREMDLSMKYNHNGRERDRGDWDLLVSQVDSRLHVRSIVSPPGSLLSIIEIAWTPADSHADDSASSL